MALKLNLKLFFSSFVVIPNQALKFHNLNTDREHVIILTIITDHVM